MVPGAARRCFGTGAWRGVSAVVAPVDAGVECERGPHVPTGEGVFDVTGFSHPAVLEGAAGHGLF